MTKLSRAVIACISAIMILPVAASIARSNTFTYNLNNRLTGQDGGLGDPTAKVGRPDPSLHGGSGRLRTPHKVDNPEI
jgi:hypothetical protein